MERSLSDGVSGGSRREHPPETVWQAQELYCVARLPMDEVASQIGVATSTLWRWCNAYGWRDKREQLAQAQAEMRADLVLARSRMIKSLLEDKDPMVGFAVAKLETLAMQQAEAERAGKLAAQTAQALAAPRREIRTLADAVAALGEALEVKLNALLAAPDSLDVAGMRDLKGCMDLLTQLKAQHAAEEKAGGKAKGLSRETAELIEKKILGRA